MKLTDIYDIYNTLAPKLSFLGKIVVAGGSVRDFLLQREPKDFDLFILGPKIDTVSFPNKFQDFCRLQLDLEPYSSDLDWHKSEPFWLTNLQIKGAEVQVMHRELRDTETLLDTFDWDISQFALDENGISSRRDISTIKSGEFLNLSNVTYPLSTLRRGYRFSERFEMRLKNQDIKKLCAMIAAKENIKDYEI